MNLPECRVPSRAAWEKIRSTAGGKSGLSKVSMGKNLDAFHAAAIKASNTGDLAPLNIAIGTLNTKAHAYLEDIRKLKKYPKLETAVTQDIIGKLSAFVKGMEQAARDAGAEINRVEHEIRNRIDMVKRTTTECNNRVNPMLEAFEEMVEKYKFGVPRGEHDAVAQKVNTWGAALNTYKKAINELDESLVEVVSQNIKDHRPIVDKLNTELGQAKGQIKKCLDGIKLGLGRTIEIGEYLKKTAV